MGPVGDFLDIGFPLLKSEHLTCLVILWLTPWAPAFVGPLPLYDVVPQHSKASVFGVEGNSTNTQYLDILLEVRING